MSFGFSVGDIFATLKLADDLKKRFAQAPSEFKAISGEIKSLWAVLHDLNDIPKDGISVQQKSEMESIVQKGREVLLEIESKLSKYNVLAYTTSNWKTKALRAWSRINWDPAEVNSLRSRITSCISLFNLVMGKINQDLTMEIGADIHSIKGNYDIQLRNEMLHWICPIDPSDQQRKVVNMRREGTGRWFLESEKFLSWIANGKGKALFCTGAPGAGKTVLTSIIIDHLEKTFADHDSVGITYLYFDFRQQLEFSDILSSLLRQLLQGNPGLHGAISDLHSRRQRNPGRLSEEEIQKELELVISRCGKVFFVIDALDECLDVRLRRQFLIWIKKLVSNSLTTIKVLATTRHNNQYFKDPHGMDLTMEIKASREDIESFLDASLDYLPGFIQRKPELWVYIRSQIITSAGEIFLLARLYLNLLFDEKNEKRVRTLGTQLQSGSGAYDHAYDETMKRIKQQGSFSQDLAKRILGWVTFSARPLTAIELQYAVAVEIGEPLFDETNITDIEEMISVCSGLVIIEEKSKITKLVHFTAQEYLKRTQHSWFTDAYHFLTDTCLTYLSFEDFGDSCSTKDDPQIQREGYPFYQYSAHEIGTHLRQSLGNVSLLLAFITNNAKVSRCMRETFGLSGTDCSFTGLHLASLFGLEHILEEFSHINSNFNVWDYLGRTPLTWAAGSGNERVVKLLIDRGSNCNSATKEGFTPLFYAAAYGHVAVVKILIDAGANVNFENKTHETPIFFAAKGGCEVRFGHRLLFNMGDYASVIKLLLDAGANLDHRNSHHASPLSVAAENGNEEAVKMLLERASINSNSRDIQGIAAQALTAAARKGHIKISKLLIESGADAPPQYGRYQRENTNVSPSVYALSCLSNSGMCEDKSSSAAVLEESGILSFQDEFNRLPLHWAASRGNSNLVQRILMTGCYPNPKDIFGRTPLFAAVCMDRVHVVKLFLDHPDVDAEIEDKLGFTPLQESYRRQKSPNNEPCSFPSLRGKNSGGHWEEVTNLLKAKTGLREECLPNVNILPFARYLLPQAQFYEHCDVCLDTRTLFGSTRNCKSCDMVMKKDGTPGGTVIYCTSCIQGAKSCPLCGQNFDA